MTVRYNSQGSKLIYIPLNKNLFPNLKISKLTCGTFHCLALTSIGNVLAWGKNRNGKLGIDMLEDDVIYPTLVKISIFSLFKIKIKYYFIYNMF